MLSWTRHGEEASLAGKKLHREIELFLNCGDLVHESESFQQFRKFFCEFATPRNWIPYRTEWAIFHEEYEVAGQIDCVFKDTTDDTYHMVDWKRVEKDIDENDGHQYKDPRYGFGPCAHMLDNKFNTYLLQQNLYAYILRDGYNFQISSMWVVQIHPRRASYTCFQVSQDTDIAKRILSY